MTDTFNSDQENQGTTESQQQGTADKSGTELLDAGNKLQQQIDVMQKRMGDKDTHISSVEKENQALRENLADINERLDKMGTVEEALARIGEKNESTQDTGLDENTLKSVMKDALPSLLAESAAEVQASVNFKQVADALANAYGKDKADETVERIAKENGLAFDDMVALARKSPSAVMKMAGITTAQAAPSQGTHIGYNDDSQNKEQKLAYFSKLKKDDPKEYYKPEVQKKFRETCLST